MINRLPHKDIKRDHLSFSFLVVLPDVKFFRKGGEESMRTFTVLLTIAISVVFVGSAFAVAPGKSVEYAGGGEGKVVFDGKVHEKSKCNDCHPKLFQMKKGAFKMTKKDHESDKGCGACHNGKTAFAQSDKASCGKCHKK